MNARWKISTATCTAAILCGVLLATAAEPNIGQYRSVVQTSARQAIEKPQFQGQLHNFFLVRTRSAVRPIDNPGVHCPPIQPAVPQRCVNSTTDLWAGWPQDLVEFFHE